jgi:DNA-binding beta-propeller fold protein YncE
MENNLNSKSGLLEHYSFQQQQAKLLASGGGHANSSLQLLRSKMIYHCKFGEFGITDGQFTEPSGVTINTNNDIIVADTNSHRIQIFDKDGRFKFKFGECGKRDGQLLYPNRVSIVKQTGDIVVTERSPTHQIQIYNKYGQFLRKFGANILQHPRGVCVDYKGRIVVVECKVMRVLIFDLYGNVLQKFDCSKYLEFPNGVCCSNPLNNPSLNTPEEIYISDNRAHCIKVFDYNGNFIRQIGGEGITNYPIGVGINSNNEILVADNHNNFNLTVFTPDGQLINALESKVKHAQCFDVGLMDDGSIVLASKDYRIYVYKYGGSSSEYTLSPSCVNANQLLSPLVNNSSGSASSDYALQSSKSNFFNMLTSNPIDQMLSHCSNNDDQSIIDNFEINHIENLFNDSLEQQHNQNSSSSTDLPETAANIEAQSYFSSNFSILNEIL